MDLNSRRPTSVVFLCMPDMYVFRDESLKPVFKAEVSRGEVECEGGR